MSGAEDPRDALPAGQVMTREKEAALMAAWTANGFAALSTAQVAAAVGPAETYPATLPLLPEDREDAR